jgi:hypothetical protein
LGLGILAVLAFAGAGAAWFADRGVRWTEGDTEDLEPGEIPPCLICGDYCRPGHPKDHDPDCPVRKGNR